MNIPILDLGPEIDSLWDELQAAIQSVLKSGHFIMGANVKAFEEEVAKYLDVKHAIGLNSGTDALFIALRALGIGPGDEVVTTPFTFFATAEAISHVGATPVFVDIDPSTLCMDVARIESAVTKRTKAILPVHLYGRFMDMEPVMSIAHRYGLRVLEDVAQAFGAGNHGTKAGTVGHMGAYSFFPSKNLGAYGDGGLVVTNDDELADMARMLRVHGSRKKYHNEVVGYNSRLDEIQAAILRVKLPHVAEWNVARGQAAHRYRELLSGVPDLLLPTECEGIQHVYHQYTVRVLGGKRDLVQTRLAEAGIGTMIYYPTPVHRLPVYNGKTGRFQVSEQAAAEVLSLPIWPQITEETQALVASEIRRVLQ